MADDVEMTPITPEEGGSVPPKVSPFGASAAKPSSLLKPATPAPAAAAAPAGGSPTVQLKPVIRKPMIHKPTIGGAKPSIPAASSAALKKATQNLKSVTGPIPVSASLKKTGIIAEGIITPAQQQAAKSKTSRISLESAIGVAPVKEGPAPLKTIRLRRPTDLKPVAGPTPLAAPAPADSAPAPSPINAAPTPIAPAAPAPEAVGEKKTLKLHRPGTAIKRPSFGASMAAPAAAAPADEVKNISDMPASSGLSAIPSDAFSAPAAEPSSGVPGWVAAISLITTLAALVAVGLLMYYFWMEGVGPQAGANEMQFIQM